MVDPRISRLAHLLVTYSVKVQPGDKVLIRGNSLSLPLVSETYREVLLAGGHPTVFWEEEIFSEIMLKEASEEQLRYVAEPVKVAMETYDCLIGLRGSRNTRTLSNVDPSRQQIAQIAGRNLMQTFMERSARGELRWTTTIFPTDAHAQEADMSLTEFADFVFAACYVDQEDPVAEWQKVHTRQQKLVEWLAGKDQVQVKGPNVDLKLSIKDRVFINADGTANMPDGEVFTGPVEDSVNGWIRYTYPAIYNGREVEGIELRFEDGRVCDAHAKKNEEFLISVLDTDAGSRYLGEFAIGTNYSINRFTKSILYDEKIGGTLHTAVGSGYPQTGSKNRSSVHWDMICDMRNGSQIWVDGELFYENGRFVVA
ncbi:MAG: aminopeptidase [Ardenticatenaceae bacterium]|nr:aminopeptidase [Ardenticatenaceae bacterium]MCB8988578.1 aminopeptidase [Ardenticatenaceae bacterium]